MKKVYLSRIPLDDCTVGILDAGDFRLCTIELPWINNEKLVSCIPKGTYICKNNHKSPSQGSCISITSVVNRSDILIHVANFTSDLLGCIGVGDSIRDLNSKPMVTNSKTSLKLLMKELPDEFLLVIS